MAVLKGNGKRLEVFRQATMNTHDHRQDLSARITRTQAICSPGIEEKMRLLLLRNSVNLKKHSVVTLQRSNFMGL
jgi:hypothetical protein